MQGYIFTLRHEYDFKLRCNFYSWVPIRALDANMLKMKLQSLQHVQVQRARHQQLQALNCWEKL